MIFTSNRDAPGKRRWLNYSLRSLLVVMLAAALVVGGWQALIAPYARQAEAIEALTDAGAAVATRNAAPMWLSGWVDPEATRTIIGVHCSDPKATEVFFRHAPGLRDLSSLHVTGWSFGDEELRRLAANEKLRQLTLDSAAVNDEAIAALQEKLPDLMVARLENHAQAAVQASAGGSLSVTYDADSFINGVYVRGAPFEDQHVAALRGLHRLRWLDLSSTPITDAALADLQLLHNLETLDLRETPISGEGYDALRQALPECEIRY